MTKALGIDIGGTGIKGAIVDVATGELLTERVKLPTPEGGSPDAIIETVVQIIEQLGGVEAGIPVGICFPAVVHNGVTMSAANVSHEWIGLEAEKLFEKGLGREIHFVNDADAAGYAEVRFGSAKDVSGLVLMTTLGTGIGTALIYNGVLVPNSELGHLEIHGKDAESRAAYSAKEREDLSWKRWAGPAEVLLDPRSPLLPRPIHRRRWRVEELRVIPAASRTAHADRASHPAQQRGYPGGRRPGGHRERGHRAAECEPEELERASSYHPRPLDPQRVRRTAALADAHAVSG